MEIKTISVKELRQHFPEIRKQLNNGVEFILIHRSSLIAKISPIQPSGKGAKAWRVNDIAGGFTLQKGLNKKLTPAFINKLSSKRYG